MIFYDTKIEHFKGLSTHYTRKDRTIHATFIIAPPTNWTNQLHSGNGIEWFIRLNYTHLYDSRAQFLFDVDVWKWIPLKIEIDDLANWICCSFKGLGNPLIYAFKYTIYFFPLLSLASFHDFYAIHSRKIRIISSVYLCWCERVNVRWCGITMMCCDVALPAAPPFLSHRLYIYIIIISNILFEYGHSIFLYPFVIFFLIELYAIPFSFWPPYRIELKDYRNSALASHRTIFYQI